MKLIYPALFEPCENGSGFTVTVPDLPGCITEGNSLAEAILMAQDAASGWILDEWEDGNPAPPASTINSIHTDDDSCIRLLSLDMDVYITQHGSKFVRKD